MTENNHANRARQNEMSRTEEKSLKTFASRNRSVIATLLTVILIIILIGLAGFIFYAPKEEVYIGRAEVKEIRISGKVPGRISQFLVEEGQYVMAGDTLVEIYSPEVLAKEKQAEAADRAAEAISRGISGGTPEQIVRTARQTWLGAKAALEAGEKSFSRAKRLFEEGVIPAQKFDEAEAKVKALRSAESAAASQLDLAKEGLFKEDKAAAKALVDRSAGVLDELAAYKKEAALVSPIDGRVSDIFPNRGELVGTGAPIMNISDLESFKVLYTVREDHLPSFKIGKSFDGRIPALSNLKIKMKVTKAKDMGTYAVWKATKPNGDVDLRTFEVTMVPDEIPEGLLPGMSIVLDKGQVK